MIRIGIISFAHMHAMGYARAIGTLDGVMLAGVADEQEERGRKYAEQLQTVYYSDYMELLRTDIDAVIVTSENVRHKEHVMAAANAGKHVLCEKPIATVPADAEDMIACCAANNVLLQTAFPVRFQPSVSRARQLIREGAIGRVLAVKGTNRGKCPGGWFVDPQLSGGGAVMDHTVHVVDVLRWVMDAEVSEVYAEADRLLTDAAIDDCGIISMQFTNGVFATLDCSWSRNEKYPTWGDVTVEFIGTDGNLAVNAFNQNVSVYSNERGCEWSYWGDSMDTLLLRDFAASIREGKRMASITGEDGLRALEVAVASYRSARERQPVALR